MYKRQVPLLDGGETAGDDDFVFPGNGRQQHARFQGQVLQGLVQHRPAGGDVYKRQLLQEYYSLMHIAEEWVEWEYLEIFPASQDL